ncbi:hypothetical protein Tsubulata_025115 [Turnera subulata]|uniref:Translation initiation factor IF-1, chloroplastic n=1 Tax=Turnera subulata TaxID=218843 RepID=A0A9Q0G564_9ROSI|nr:hypothetical protein Tsubulata_025115 [Turnera subulata]
MASIPTITSTQIQRTLFPAKPTTLSSSKTLSLGTPTPTAHPLCRRLVGVVPPPRFHQPIRAGPKSNQADGKWVHEGSITESLPNGMFQIHLDNGDDVVGYISGKIRKNFVRVLPGDRVSVEVSRYDTSRGRIVYRHRKREPTTE